MQNFGVTNKEHYGILWYFLEWPIALPFLSSKKEGSANKKMKCPEPTDYVRCLLSETDESST